MDQNSYNKALKIISRFILKNFGTHNDIFEIIQSAMEVYYTKSHEGKIKPGASELTLICRIAERMWKDELKKRRKKPVLVPLSQNFADTHVSELELKKMQEVFLDRMEQRISAMKEPCRTIILRIMNGESYESMAQDMASFDLVNLRKYYFRCKEKLKAMITVDNELAKLKKLSYGG